MYFESLKIFIIDYHKIFPKIKPIFSNYDHHKYDNNDNACTNNYTEPDNSETNITSPDHAKTANR